MQRSLSQALILSFAAIYIGCGSTAVSNVLDQAAIGVRGLAEEGPYLSAPIPSDEAGNLNSHNMNDSFWKTLIQSSAYAGSVIVRFADDADLSIENGQLSSTNNRHADLLDAIRELGLQAHQLVDIDRTTMQRAQRRAIREGNRLIDWTQVFALQADVDQANALMNLLPTHNAVLWAHPMPKLWTTNVGVSTAKNVSDLSLEQTYLLETNNGLNIQPAWDLGLTGNSQHLIHYEHNWNYEHSDLNIDITTTPLENPFQEDFADSTDSIEHGTAMLGIMTAQHNSFGIKGITPNVKVHTAASGAFSASTGWPEWETMMEWIQEFAAGNDIGGQTIVHGFQALGPQTLSMKESGEYDTITACPGCIPGEAYSAVFDGMQDMVNMGIVVITGSGNGAINLDDAINQVGIDLSTQDTGALIVGASNGPNLDKADFSNCGARVNVFAWGRDIVSTGYGNHPASVADDPNQWYVNNFGGTSSAMAMIAGMAVLAQEYVDILYADQLEENEHAYLNSAQIRALFTHPDASTAPLTAECNIGVQPDMGKVLQLLADGVIQPKIVSNGVQCANTESPECQNTCAEDPLNLDAECSLICDVQPNHHLCAEWCLAMEETESSFNILADCPTTQRTIGNHQDIDGDAHADIVAWDITSRTLRVDRSDATSAGTADGYHDWDFTLTLTEDMLDEGRHIPIMHDYNHDDLADFALYNTDTGHWRILFTKPAWFNHTYTAASSNNWDVDLDYSQETAWEAGSRPLAADFDLERLTRFTNDPQAEIYQTIDRALVTPSGTWLYDFAYDAVSTDESFDHNKTLLSNEELLSAPGWAYLPTPSVDPDITWTQASFVTPDTDTNGQKLASALFGDYATNTVSSMLYNPNDLGGQANYVIPGWYGIDQEEYACFLEDHSWQTITEQIPSLAINNLPETLSTPGEPCIPVVADYDGDGADDRALLCNNNEWRIFMSASQELRTITYPQNDNLISPAKIFPGGIDYQDIIETYEPHNFGCPADETCDIFDLPPPVGPNFASCLNTGGDAMECLEQ